MPYINVRIADKKSDTKAQQVAKLLTSLAVSKLGKDASVAAVDVQFADTNNWFVGGETLTRNKEKSFYVEVKVTAGTNTRGDKQEFIKTAYQEMKNLLGEVTPTSYIVVQDVAADDWGFGGKTQGYRYIASQI